MMMKWHGVYALLLLSLIGGSAYSQENQLVTGTIVQRPAQQVVSDDTIPAINLSEEELDNIVDIRKQFEKQNKTYSEPLAPSTNLLRFLKKDELEISDEAMYWARLVRDASTIFDNTMTFRDTVIVNPLFMPIVFRHVRAGGQNGQMGDVGDGAHANQTDTILFFHMLKLTFVAAAQDLAKKPPSTAIVNPFT